MKMRRENEIPLDGETVAGIMASGDVDFLMIRLSKEEFWDVVQKSAPGYPRSLFDTAWDEFVARKKAGALGLAQ